MAYVFCGLSQAGGPRVSAAPAGADRDRRTHMPSRVKIKGRMSGCASYFASIILFRDASRGREPTTAAFMFCSCF